MTPNPTHDPRTAARLGPLLDPDELAPEPGYVCGAAFCDDPACGWHAEKTDDPEPFDLDAIQPAPGPRPPLVYLAGPMSADPLAAPLQAIHLWPTLRALGVLPFMPQLSVLHQMIDPQPYEEWMRYDLDLIAHHVDAVLRLPGDSPGADRECAHAHAHGVPVFVWGTMPERIAFTSWIEARPC